MRTHRQVEDRGIAYWQLGEADARNWSQGRSVGERGAALEGAADGVARADAAEPGGVSTVERTRPWPSAPRVEPKPWVTVRNTVLGRRQRAR